MSCGDEPQQLLLPPSPPPSLLLLSLSLTPLPSPLTFPLLPPSLFQPLLLLLLFLPLLIYSFTLLSILLLLFFSSSSYFYDFTIFPFTSSYTCTPPLLYLQIFPLLSTFYLLLVILILLLYLPLLLHVPLLFVTLLLLLLLLSGLLPQPLAESWNSLSCSQRLSSNGSSAGLLEIFLAWWFGCDETLQAQQTLRSLAPSNPDDPP